MKTAVAEISNGALIKGFESAHETLAKYQQFMRRPDYAFAKRMYGQNPARYETRLKAIEFAGLSHVLDAGCGYGQWTLLLSALNDRVTACDISSERLLIASEVSRQSGITNCQFDNGALDHLPYGNSSFDGLFCYSVIHATPWRKSLAECARVLRSGGRLYLTANGLGWYLHCWKEEPFRQDNYDPRLAAAQALVNTVHYDRSGWYEDAFSGLIIDEDAMTEQLRQCGFEIIGCGPEGSINLTGQPGVEPNFQGEYEGHCGVFEVLAIKR